MRRRLLSALALLLAAAPARATIDWARVADQAAEHLAAYIRIDTVNPPGDTRAAVDFLAAQLAADGIASERLGAVPEKPALLARLPGRGGAGKPIVLLNHMDVVAADAARWSFPPFAGEIHDGAVRGRGALDMKGLGIAMLTALRLLAAAEVRPQHDIWFLAVPDEEVGGTHGSAWLTAHHPELLEVSAVWDEGGVGLTDLLPVPALFISVTEKQVLWLKLIAEGPSGHGSRPFAGAAPRRLTQALTRVLDSPPAPRLTPVAREAFRRLGGRIAGIEGFAYRRLNNPVVWLFADGLLQQEPWAMAMTRDTLALTVLDAGARPNVIPERAEAILDCRLLPDTTPEAFIAQLRAVIDDPQLAIEILQAPEPAPPSPTNTPLYRAMHRAARHVYPGTLVTPSMTTGGTDSRFFRRHGVPSYGFFPILVSKQLTASVHGTDEQLPVEALGQATRVIYEALRAL